MENSIFGENEAKKGRKKKAQEELTELDVEGNNKKTPGRRSKKEKIAPEEIAEKLHILFGGLAKIMKYEYPYSPTDFEQESKAVVRLSEKFPFISSFISVFDPVLVILGLWFKWQGIKKKEVKENVENAQNNVTTIRSTFGIFGSNRERENVSGKQDASGV